MRKGAASTIVGVCVAMLAGGCGLGTGTDKKAARELADRLMPGQLRVLGARTLVPETTGSEVTFALTSDPDAVMRLRIDAKKGHCGRKPCEAALTAAVTKAKAQATEFRLLRAALERCGRQIIALGPGATEPWIAVELTNDNVTSVLKALGLCATHWSASSSAPTSDGSYGLPEGTRSLQVHLVSPRIANDRPQDKSQLPTMARLNNNRLLAALSRQTYFTAGFVLRGDQQSPVTADLTVARTYKDREAFGRSVRTAVAERLRQTHPDAEVVDYTGVWRLQTGRIDRFTGYVLFCEHSDASRRCMGDHAVKVTVDAAGVPVGSLEIVRDVRDGATGPLRLPPLS